MKPKARKTHVWPLKQPIKSPEVIFNHKNSPIRPSGLFEVGKGLSRHLFAELRFDELIFLLLRFQILNHLPFLSMKRQH